jgi:PAS domain S-box-containing protein
MTDRVDQPAELRGRAEGIARERAAQRPTNLDAATPEEVPRLLHDLRVHQIELELQNEELRRAQVELDASRARYFDLYDLAPVGYCSLSEQGLILEANLTAATLLGAARGALVQQPFSRFVHRDDQDGFYLHRKRLLETGEPQGCELRLQRIGGEPFWAKLEASLAPADTLARTSRVVLSDVSERRRAEQERRALEVSLAQSDRLASLGMLAAGVAHELNNPLAYVLYHVECLAQELPGLAERLQRYHAALQAAMSRDELARALGPDHAWLDPATLADAPRRAREALEGVLRIRQITRSLGTFSRVEPAEVSPVSLQSCLEHALDMAQNEIRYRARVVRDYAQIPTVLASEGRLTQVFLNLIVNAAQAIDEGHVERNEIRVRTYAEDDLSCAAVSDTGRGIAAEHQAKVFEPFFTTKGVGVGSGLGLPICRNIVQGFGGEIAFTSEPGQGARFVIKLPRLPHDWSGPASRPEPPDPGRPLARGRILVVDDEAGIRWAISRMLEREHDLVTASSGAEAKALLEKDRGFDLVLSDLMMPELSGMELHAWLSREAPALAERVVFITGGAFTPGAAEYLARTRNLLIEKPFDTRGFRKLVGELVLAARARDEG